MKTRVWVFRLRFKCPSKECGAVNVLDGVFRRRDDGDVEYALARCANGQCRTAPYSYWPALLNRLTLLVRGHVHRYYTVSRICLPPHLSSSLLSARLLELDRVSPARKSV